MDLKQREKVILQKNCKGGAGKAMPKLKANQRHSDILRQKCMRDLRKNSEKCGKSLNLAYVFNDTVPINSEMPSYPIRDFFWFKFGFKI